MHEWTCLLLLASLHLCPNSFAKSTAVAAEATHPTMGQWLSTAASGTKAASQPRKRYKGLRKYRCWTATGEKRDGQASAGGCRQRQPRRSVGRRMLQYSTCYSEPDCRPAGEGGVEIVASWGRFKRVARPG